MKAGMYPKLAWLGMRKNGRLYTPYFLTCAGMTAMYYIILFLATSPLLSQMRGGSASRAALTLGSYVMAIFTLIFLFYTNSFLLRRRKKEFGLYNILGMGKANLACILLWETLINAVLSLLAGLAGGVVLSKLAELLLINILKGAVSLDFSISVGGLLGTAGIFALIYLLIYLNALRQLRGSTATQLLRSENVGEKPPRANYVLGLLGVVLLAGAYTLAVSIQKPLEAMLWFFVAVAMVIVASYLLFVSGSVLLCRMLQKNKRFYYRPDHFISVSSMTYRMKRNGAGLASICILATMVLVMLSSTACLYFGAESTLSARHPRQLSVSVAMDQGDGLLNDENIDVIRQATLAATGDITRVDEVEYRAIVTVAMVRDGTVDWESDAGDEVGAGMADVARVTFLSLADYNRLADTRLTLGEDEAMVYPQYAHDTLTLTGVGSWRVTRELSQVPGVPTSTDLLMDICVVIPTLEQLEPLFSSPAVTRAWHYGFDTPEGEERQLEVYDTWRDAMRTLDLEGGVDILYTSVDSVVESRDGFYATNGGLFFLGILLSVVFLFAAVLMIYYKQISEGYEDQARFDIMQKVGMTRRGIRRSINAQLLLVFFLPLLGAGLHLAFAFPMVRRVIRLFGMYQLSPLLIASIVVFLAFALFYTIVYRITSNAYYHIVSGAREEA